MERPTRAGVQAIALAVTVLFLLPLQPKPSETESFQSVHLKGKPFTPTKT
jgi:hypothetical protein